MRISRSGRFERTDVWREGRWLDLWSVVHLLSGVSIGFGMYLLHLGTFSSVVIVLLGLIAYEMWEKIVGIEEALTNRVMDVVVGMLGFLISFPFAQNLPTTQFILVSGFVLTANIVTSIFGWVASQKAAELKRRVRARYARQRARLRGEAKLLEEEILHKK